LATAVGFRRADEKAKCDASSWRPRVDDGGCEDAGTCDAEFATLRDEHDDSDDRDDNSDTDNNDDSVPFGQRERGTLAAFFLLVSPLLTLMMAAHRWAHARPEAVPVLARAAQACGLLISRAHHAQHHVDYGVNFAIFTGHIDPLLNWLTRQVGQRSVLVVCESLDPARFVCDGGCLSSRSSFSFTRARAEICVLVQTSLVCHRGRDVLPASSVAWLGVLVGWGLVPLSVAWVAAVRRERRESERRQQRQREQMARPGGAGGAIASTFDPPAPVGYSGPHLGKAL